MLKYENSQNRMDVGFVHNWPKLELESPEQNNRATLWTASLPILVPCKLFLLLNMKKWLGGKSFAFNKKVIVQTNVYFAEFEELYFLKRLKKLENCSIKCIELEISVILKSLTYQKVLISCWLSFHLDPIIIGPLW